MDVAFRVASEICLTHVSLKSIWVPRYLTDFSILMAELCIFNVVGSFLLYVTRMASVLAEFVLSFHCFKRNIISCAEFCMRFIAL